MSLINETLDLWREAERLLESVAPTAPEHETVALVAIDLRALYASLTDTSTETPCSLAASQETLASSRALLERIRKERAHGLDHWGMGSRPFTSD